MRDAPDGPSSHGRLSGSGAQAGTHILLFGPIFQPHLTPLHYREPQRQVPAARPLDVLTRRGPLLNDRDQLFQYPADLDRASEWRSSRVPQVAVCAKGEETRQRREAATSPIQDQSGDARHTSSFAATQRRRGRTPSRKGS